MDLKYKFYECAILKDSRSKQKLKSWKPATGHKKSAVSITIAKDIQRKKSKKTKKFVRVRKKIDNSIVIL